MLSITLNACSAVWLLPCAVYPCVVRLKKPLCSHLTVMVRGCCHVLCHVLTCVLRLEKRLLSHVTVRVHGCCRVLYVCVKMHNTQRNTQHTTHTPNHAQTKELGKNACGPNGAAPALDKRAAERLKKMIDQDYRVRMVLDNLPVTVYDLQSDVSDWKVLESDIIVGWGG